MAFDNKKISNIILLIIYILSIGLFVCLTIVDLLFIPSLVASVGMAIVCCVFLIVKIKKGNDFIGVYNLCGLFLLFFCSLLTLFIGKTNWIWQTIILPLFIVSSYGTIKYVSYLIVNCKNYSIKAYRIIINIVCIIVFVALSIIFSVDTTFFTGEGEIDLIVLAFIIALFYFPFKTGHTMNRLSARKKKE